MDLSKYLTKPAAPDMSKYTNVPSPMAVPEVASFFNNTNPTASGMKAPALGGDVPFSKQAPLFSPSLNLTNKEAPLPIKTQPWIEAARTVLGSEFSKIDQEVLAARKQDFEDMLKYGPQGYGTNRAGEAVGQAVGGGLNILKGGAESAAGSVGSALGIKGARNLAEQGVIDTGSGVLGVVTSPFALAPKAVQHLAGVPFELITDTAGKLIDEHSPGTPEEKRLAKEAISTALGLGSLFLVGSKEGGPTIKGGIKAAGEFAKAVKSGDLVAGIKDAATIAKEKIKPTTPEMAKAKISEAAGRVGQGEISDVAPVAKSVAGIDVSKVKSYDDLYKQFDEGIKARAKQVDTAFESVDTKYKLSNFDKEVKSGDTVIKTNPVKDALDNLKELYQKTNNPEGLARITELMSKAEKYTLTLKDINNLAREYGQQKSGFNVDGQPSTSVTKQGYENTRKAVKEAARSEMPDETTKALDKEMTDMMKARELADTLREKVNKFKQTHEKLGVVAKLAGGAVDIVDVITRGGLKGMVRKLIGKSSEFEGMNIMDMQKQMVKDINAIDKYTKMFEEDPAKATEQVKKDAKAAPKAKWAKPIKTMVDIKKGKRTSATVIPDRPSGFNTAGAAESAKVAYRTEKAHSSYKGKAVYGEGLYLGIDKNQVAEMTLNPHSRTIEKPDYASVKTITLPSDLKLKTIDLENMSNEEFNSMEFGNKFKEQVLDEGYDGAKILTGGDLNLGGDQIVIYSKKALKQIK